MKSGTREEYYNLKKTLYADMGRHNCPFCAHDSDEQKEFVIWRGKNWCIVRNKFPYTNTMGHIMAIPYKHKCVVDDLSAEDFSELKDVHTFVKGFFGDDSYFSFIRETLENRSLEHYHIHFLNGKLKGSSLREMLKKQGLFD